MLNTQRSAGRDTISLVHLFRPARTTRWRIMKVVYEVQNWTYEEWESLASKPGRAQHMPGMGYQLVVESDDQSWPE